MSFLLSNELASCSCPHAYCALCWVFACSMYSVYLSRLNLRLPILNRLTFTSPAILAKASFVWTCCAPDLHPFLFPI